MWQNLEAHGKYYPRGTNVLMCTVIGSYYDTVSTWSKEQASVLGMKLKLDKYILAGDGGAVQSASGDVWRSCCVS